MNGFAEIGKNLVKAIQSHQGKKDGMGYVVDQVVPGRGYSCREWSSRVMPNGRHVACMTYYPGFLDSLTGQPSEITSVYSVFVGWEEYNPEYERLYQSPPGLSLPDGATGWGDAAYDGPRNWFAEFEDPDAAERFAMALPPYKEGDEIPPMKRAVQ